MPFYEAYARGLFKHTESDKNWSGSGQGEWKKVQKKLSENDKIKHKLGI